MKNALILIGLCLLSVIHSCSNQKLSTFDNLQNVDIEANINNLEVIKLSQFTDNVQYVPLQTKDYFVIHRNCRFDFLDSLILIYDLNHCQLFNSNGKFLSTIGSRGRGPAEFQFCVQACFRNSNSIYLQSLYDLFEYRLDGSIVKKYDSNFKIPASSRPNGIGGKELWSHISLNEVFQTENYLFLNCMFGDRFPAKRLTLSSSQMGSSWYNTTFMLGIVDKRSGILKFCKPTSTDNPLFTTGIYNDIDAGPRFFPVQMVNDSTMVMVVDAKELKDHVKSDDFRKSKSKYPEKKEQLAKLSDSISEMDNGVLMFVTFKK